MQVKRATLLALVATWSHAALAQDAAPPPPAPTAPAVPVEGPPAQPPPLPVTPPEPPAVGDAGASPVQVAPRRVTSRADAPGDAKPVAKWVDADAWLWARARTTRVSAFPVDRIGTKNDLGSFVETRLRLGASVRPLASLEVHVEADALSGIAAGDSTQIGTGAGSDTLRYRLDRRFGITRAELRQAFLSIDLPFGQLRLGRMAFSWGTGMLANGGGGEPDFGDRRYGDLVHRVAFATKPMLRSSVPEALKQLTLFVGADAVYRDENADFDQGDRAYGGVLGARTETPGFTAGVFGSIRTQKDREELSHPERGRTTVKARAVDVYAAGTVWTHGSAKAVLEGEAALVFGTTTRPYLDETRDGATVRSGGGVARAVFQDDALRLRVAIEAGYASGDNDTHDDVVRTFAFDPDYKVGLVLFDPVLARLSARAVDRVTDPALLAVPPAGARYLATQGAVSNTVYVNPTVRVRPLDPLELRAGYLLAFAAADLVDPYESAKRGGYNTTWGGVLQGSHALGHEVDLSVRYTLLLTGSLRVRGLAEGGVLLPGAAFRGLDLGTVSVARAGLDVLW